MAATQLDDISRYDEVQKIINKKTALRQFYLDMYSRFNHCLKQCPKEGLVLELGSGGGFLKSVLPEVITSDVLAYPGVDQTIDGASLPFPDQSLRAIFMLNVFHHLPNVAAFLMEAQRCLVPKGRLFIIDQHLGWLSKPIYTHLHHEPINMDTSEWKFDTTGPLSGANQALAWIVFRRDLHKFKKLYPNLKLLRYAPHTPIRYWLAGGLKNWSLIPGFLGSWVTVFDRIFVQISPDAGSFVDIEIEKT